MAFYQITFADSDRPTLTAGSHTLKVAQDVSVLQDGQWVIQESFVREQDLIVEAPRYAIDPQLVHDVHPPANQASACNTTLPHIVLSDSTLPWQRLVKLASDASNTPRPWLALLLFRAEEAPSVVLKEMSGGAEGSVQSAQAPQITIDSELLDSLLPDADELDALVHVRDVKPTRKADVDGEDPDRRFAVVVGKRMPVQDGFYVAHLVSMENLGVDARSTDSNSPIALTSLYRWQFQAQASASTSLIDRLKDLDPGPLAIPIRAPRADDSDEAKWVKETLAHGYCALNHDMRGPAKSVSWYRGPLQPYTEHAVQVSPQDMASVNADKLLRYDPAVGMFDVSHAAAWQLGRLCALDDPDFSATLFRWRSAAIRKSARERTLETQAQDEVRRVTPMRPQAAFNDFGKTFKIDRAELRSELRMLAERQAFSPAKGHPGFDEQRDDGKTLSEWLVNLATLAKVPLHYLVPNGNMLPTESLRFFSLDRNWIRALLAGALSLGGEDAAEISRVYERLLATVRSEKTDLISGEEPVSGFLLRSSVLKTWGGIEVIAKTDLSGVEAANPLRLDILSPGIMLGLYRGIIGSLEFVEPAESLTFAAPAKKPFVFKDEARGVIDMTALVSFRGGSAAVAEALAQKGRSIRFAFKPQA